MVGAQDLLSNGQGPLQQGFGLGVAPLGLIERGQVAEACGHVGLLGAESLLEERQGSLVQGFGVGITPLVVVGLAGGTLR
jgi:hypothetical protein